MIKPAPQSDPDGSRGDRHDAVHHARSDFDAVMDALPPLIEQLQDDTLEDLRPRLTEMMKRLLNGTRIVVDVAEGIPGSMHEEVEAAQRLLSERLLDFRRAMGSGSTDTIRKSLRDDLEASATLWNRLLDGLNEVIQSNDHENG